MRIYRSLIVVLCFLLLQHECLSQVNEVVDSPLPLSGTIFSIREESLIVQPKWTGAPVIITVDTQARILVDMRRAEFSDLRPQMSVAVSIRRWDESDDVEGDLYIHAWSPALRGEVMRVDSESITLEAMDAAGLQQGLVVPINDETSFQETVDGVYIPNHGILTVQDIRPGMRVSVVMRDGTADKIFVYRAKKREAGGLQGED